MDSLYPSLSLSPSSLPSLSLSATFPPSLSALPSIPLSQPFLPPSLSALPPSLSLSPSFLPLSQPFLPPSSPIFPPFLLSPVILSYSPLPSLSLLLPSHLASSAWVKALLAWLLMVLVSNRAPDLLFTGLLLAELSSSSSLFFKDGFSFS